MSTWNAVCANAEHSDTNGYWIGPPKTTRALAESDARSHEELFPGHSAIVRRDLHVPPECRVPGSLRKLRKRLAMLQKSGRDTIPLLTKSNQAVVDCFFRNPDPTKYFTDIRICDFVLPPGYSPLSFSASVVYQLFYNYIESDWDRAVTDVARVVVTDVMYPGVYPAEALVKVSAVGISNDAVR